MENDAKTPASEASQESPRPKIVRNRDVDKAAAAIAEDHVLPLPPGKNLSWDQAQQYLSLLSPAMWSHVMIYVYRVKPKIRRQLRDPNSPNYIDCLSEPFTLDYFISRHGGGKYQLQAVDTEARRDSNGSQLFKCNMEINDVQHPPILNYDELEIEARENKSYITWLQNKGILDGKGNVVQPQAAGQPAASGPASLAAKEVLDILGYAHKMTTEQQNQFRAQFAPGEDSLSKSVGQILLEKMKQDDPGKDWDRMMTFIEKVTMQKQPDNGFAQMLQMQQEQRKTDLEYTRLLLENQNRNSTEGQFGQFREIISFARELWQSGGGGGRRSAWDTGLEIARDVALPAIQSIGGIVTNIMALRNGAAPVAPMPAAAQPAAVQGAFDPYANPGAARQYASTLAAQQPAQQTPPQPPPQPPPPGGPAAPEAQLFGLFQQYGNLVVNALNNGTPGYDFADWITGLLGTATHAMIAGQGEAALAATMLQIPEIAIFGEVRVRTFVNEFVHYEEFLANPDGPEEEPQPEPEIEMPKVYRPPQRAARRI